MGRENLKALTSLRFFAALSIVWLHAKLYFDWARVGPELPLDNGVSFFFVLSGFILTHVHGDAELSFSKFMRGRIARLWPLHLVCLAVVFFFVRADSQSFDGPGLQSKWFAMIPNALLMQSWWPSQASVFSWNAVSWSISTEMFFYVMFPLLVVLLSKRPVAFIAICFLPLPIIFILVRWLETPSDQGVFALTLWSYAFPPGRLLEFGLGMIACRIWQRARPTPSQSRFVPASVIELSALGMLCVWFGALYPLLFEATKSLPTLWDWFAHSGSAFVFAIFIPMMASGRGAVGRLLSARPLILLGESSFALYMVHQIVMKVIALNHPSLMVPEFVILACLAAALVGHFLIERPGRGAVLALWLNVPAADWVARFKGPLRASQ